MKEFLEMGFPESGVSRHFKRRILLRNSDRAPAGGGKTGEMGKKSDWISPKAEEIVAAKALGTYFQGGMHDGGKRAETEKLWRELFSEPSEWCDSRLDKRNPRFPDFKHKKTHIGLWLNSTWNPPWVEAKLAAMPTGSVESNNFCWNQRLSRCSQAGKYKETMQMFQQTQQLGMVPNGYTFVPVLKACAGLRLLEHGRLIHAEILKRGFEVNIFLGSSLVDMYAKCGSIDRAERVFNQMPARDVVAWNAMIVGCVKCGEGQKALSLSKQMQQDGVAPDRVTFMGILDACASVTALEEGRRTHDEIIQRGYESSVKMGNCLLDMYVKCGSLEEAEKVFNHMTTKTVVTWTAMTEGYSSHGYVKNALETFKRMCEIVEVDGTAFTPLLSACSHGGFVDEGLDCFKSMSAVHNITPTLEHYGCLVDLLGRAGRLYEAEELIRSMPMKPDVTIWMSLLGACRVHGNVDMGELCVKLLLELGSHLDNQASHVLLSNIYAAAGIWDSRAIVKSREECRGNTRAQLD